MQEYLASLDDEWEERLERCTLAVQNSLEVGVALLLFPIEVAATPEDRGQC